MKEQQQEIMGNRLYYPCILCKRWIQSGLFFKQIFRSYKDHEQRISSCSPKRLCTSCWNGRIILLIISFLFLLYADFGNSALDISLPRLLNKYNIISIVAVCEQMCLWGTFSPLTAIFFFTRSKLIHWKINGCHLIFSYSPTTLFPLPARNSIVPGVINEE